MTAPVQIDPVRQEILHAEGHLLIEGGPGCGKTTIALLKADRLLERLEPEQRVLFLSFSRAAVRQIRDRTKDTLSRRSREMLEVRTFHAFFLDMVRAHSGLLTGQPATVIPPDRARHLQADFEGDDWEAETRRLASQGTFVFDQFGPTAAELLKRWESVRRLYHQRYPVVIIDEFQDTDESQWGAVRLLAERSDVICLADPEQRIYDFLAGVSETRIQEMVDALDPRRFDLSADNHRSPHGGLLQYANAVGRDQPADPPETVRLAEYTYDHLPVTHSVVLRLQAHLRKQLEVEPSIAVLAATKGFANSISDGIANNTSYNGTELPAVEHSLLLDHALTTSAGYAVASVLEWSTGDPRQAAARTLHHIADYYRVKLSNGVLGARNQISTLLRAADAIEAGGTPLSSAGKRVLEAATFGQDWRGRPIVDWALARDQLQGATQLTEVAKAARFLRVGRISDPVTRVLAERWNGTSGYEDVVGGLQRYFAEEMLAVDEPAADSVQVMNMHKSKGKEFDGVILVEGLHQAKWSDERWSAKEEADFRRVLRVALTRARHIVVLVRPTRVQPLTRPAANAK